jgi:RNA polymerase sigma-70 factor (ECF subfamily)
MFPIAIAGPIPSLERGEAAMAETERDLDLIRRLAAGDESAVGDLVAAYGQRLYAYALRLTDDPALADDVTQDALVTAWQTARRFRGEGRPIAWLLGIVHHTALKAVRRRPQRISDEMEQALVSPVASPEELAQAGQQAEWIRLGLQRLSPEHRAVLELVFYQGLRLEEVARVCRVPLGTVKSRLSYARKQLRGVLLRSGEVEEEAR